MEKDCAEVELTEEELAELLKDLPQILETLSTEHEQKNEKGR